MHRYRSPRMRLHVLIAHLPPATQNIMRIDQTSACGTTLTPKDSFKSPAEGGSQCSFAPQSCEIDSKMECLAGRKCVFSHCKTDDFVFSPEIAQTSACGTTLTPKKSHLFRSHSSCYYFESPSGRQVIRFDTDFECKQAPEPSPNCRFR